MSHDMLVPLDCPSQQTRNTEVGLAKFGQPADAAWRCGLASVLPLDGALALERFVRLSYLRSGCFQVRPCQSELRNLLRKALMLFCDQL